MTWEELLKIAEKLPVIETENLLAGNTKPEGISVQLSRWVKRGRLIQIRRGLYLVAAPFRNADVNEAALAGIIRRPSYVSLEKALEYHGLIPEMVTTYTCVTTKRPERIYASCGSFEYRHIKPSLFWGYEATTIAGQTAYYALPEKALLDLFYLKKPPATPEYLKEMRLQNVESVNLDTLRRFAQRFGKTGIARAAQAISEHVRKLGRGEKQL